MKPLVRYTQSLFICFILSFTVPFLLSETFFPFFYFGMYSQPPKNQTPQEQFLVLYYQNPQATPEVLQAKNLYLGTQHFQNLMRKYHYLNNHTTFLTHLQTVLENKNISYHHLEWLRIEQQDTTKLGEAFTPKPQ
ncbi:MAG: hypothetical protein JJT94_10735 [Bernardetiaceae bacterium]|nr:hypothetical protein [Bernardetiaceae bacterium]